MDVKVLGTTFDVNTYEDEGKSFVVLVEGLVEVSAGKGESRIITPGYIAEVNMHDVQAKIQVSKCDTEHYVAWKNGNFSFSTASIKVLIILVFYSRAKIMWFLRIHKFEGRKFIN